MKKYIWLFSAALIAATLAAPQFADARAGNGASVGSRGTHTYQSTPYNAQPINRSVTASPSPATAQPLPSAAYATGMPYNSGGHPFLSGIAGGFLGAGLAHMLFGGGAGAYGGGIGGSGIGLFEILLIGGGAYFLFKKFSTASMGSVNTYSAPVLPFVGGMGNTLQQNTYSSAQVTGVTKSINVTDADKEAFGQVLLHVQQTWSNGDLTKMRQFVTPEMLQYFSEQLSANASRGLANKMEQVTLQEADIAESWNEYDIDYVTAKLCWTALDYMVHLDKEPSAADYVASGSNHQPEQAQEYWTFMRAAGGHWLLSAIQQVS